jgi:CubicO group peptidase (beta-lactamase class C family)
MKSNFMIRRAPLAALVAALVLPWAARAECPTRASWPTTGWTARTAETAAAKAAQIQALEDYAFTLTGKDAERKGIRTEGVVIIKGGELIYEKYARGFDAQKRHLGWSVTKSITNALTGIAVSKGALSLEDSICTYVQAPRQENCRIKVKDVLEFATGLDWKENYEGQGNQVSSVLAQLYGEGRRDMATFVAGHVARDAPGETYLYSSGDAVLLRRQGADERYPWTFLFDPIGMKSAVYERDAKGTPVGSSYVYATPRDFAKFGYLFLNDGCWGGTRLLPEGWVTASSAVSAAFRNRPLERDGVQGRMFWLNRAVPEQQVPKPWPDAPDDTYLAKGHWGQYVFIIPSLDLVIVRTGDDRDGSFRSNDFLVRAIAVGS